MLDRKIWGAKADRSGQPLTASLWLMSDISPVLIANIVVDLDRRAATVQSIAAVALRAGNSVVVMGVHVV